MQPTLVLILKFPLERSSPMPSNLLHSTVLQDQNSFQVISLFLQLYASNFPHSVPLLHCSMLYLVSGLFFFHNYEWALPGYFQSNKFYFPHPFLFSLYVKKHNINPLITYQVAKHFEHKESFCAT